MGIVTGLGELVRMSKDCFYSGLLPENRSMGVHLKDQPHTIPLDLSRVLLEQEENDVCTHTHYPLSTLTRPSHPQKSTEPRLRWHLRWTPQYLTTPWMPWKVGTTDSSSVFSKLP